MYHSQLFATVKDGDVNSNGNLTSTLPENPLYRQDIMLDYRFVSVPPIPFPRVSVETSMESTSQS